MEKHEVDMVIQILEIFRNQSAADKENMSQMLMLAMAATKQKDKEYVQKVPEVDT